LIVTILAPFQIAKAQNSSDRGTPVDSRKGQSTQSTYARDKIETVNLANGNFSLSIPLATIGGRGSASFTLALSYNSKVWTIQSDRNGVYTENGAEGTPRNIYSAIYDNIQPEEYEPYLAKLGSGWSILTSPGIKARMIGIDPLTTGCNHFTDDQRDCGFKYALTKMWVTLPDGSQLELRDVNTQGAPALTTDLTDGYHYLKDRDRGRIWRSIDGSNIIFVRDTGYPVGQIGGGNEFPSGWVFLTDGTRLRMEQGVCSKIIDRNGNFITFTSGTYTDELGRQTLISATASTWTVTVKGYSGTPDRSLTLELGTIGDLANLRSDFHSLPRPFTTGDAFRDALDNFTDHTIQTPHTDLFIKSEGMIHNYGTTDGFDVGTRSAVTHLDLLDGRALQFRYNQYGEVAEIVYPGGGVSQIDYNGGNSGTCEIPAPFGVNRGVNERRTLANATDVDATWLYAPDAEWIDGEYRPGVVVEAHQGGATGTLLSKERHFFRMLNAEYRQCGGPYTGTGNEKWENAKEFRTEIYNGTGTSVTVRDWQQRASVVWANDVGLSYNTYVNQHGQDQPPNDTRVMSEETTLEDGKMKRVEFGYDEFNNVTSVKEYDFGTTGSPGTLLRQTFRTYLTAQNSYCYSNLNPTDSNCGSGLPSDVSTIIYQPGLVLSETIKDGANTQKARTDFEYDNYSTATNHAAIVSNSGMIQYDGARFSAFASGAQPRGNVTKVTRWLGGGTDIVSFSQYDNAGQAIWNKDPNGNISTVSYADNFGAGDTPDSGAAGPNGATFALPSVATNAASQVAKMQYNYSLGAATGVKDPNNVITKTEYDNLGRPSAVTAALGLPEQSISQMAYPTAAANEAKVSKQLDQTWSITRWLTSKTQFDGFDRPVLSATAEDGLHYDSNPSYTIFSKTIYDPLGRGKLVTNPYRAAAAVTDGWNRSTEDLAGRPIEFAKFTGGVSSPPPDTGTNSNWSGSVTTSYASEVTTITDQAGKKRRSVTDGLGRLVRVDEPDANGNLDVNGVPFQSTSYSYDTLDNLIAVTQGEQTRTFVYDSLKRLTSAVNPESGTITYQYDANGNLTQKTDARGVVSTYVYDALNRNTSVTYSNDPAATPAVTRTYDGATKGVGRLWKTESSGASGSRTTINSYDAFGRPTSQSQQFYSESAWSSALTVSATYGKAGQLLSLTYPSGHTTTYTYDGAGRNSSFAGNLGDATQRTYSSEITYSPFGAMTKEKFGTDTATYNKLFYNARSQLAEIRESTSSATDTSWELGAIINHYSNQSGCWGASCNATDNNGNLQKQEVYIKRPNSEDYDNFVQSYDYDSLNRLQVAREAFNGDGTQWQQTYVYDRYGNRTIDTNENATFGGVNNSGFELDTARNRLYAPGDLAIEDEAERQMQYDDAGNLKHDTYTGAGEREYDAENRMFAVTNNDSGTSTYTYDGDGRRVRRTLDGGITWQVYGLGGELLAEYDHSCTHTRFVTCQTKLLNEYGYRNGQLLIMTIEMSDTLWLVTDQLGTPRMIFDKTGTLAGVKRHDYLPFGEELFHGIGGRSEEMGYGPADGVRQKFTQKERDSETGLDFFEARYYASSHGRFTSTDPLMASASVSSPESWNRYTYSFNNPLRFTDPSGMAPGDYYNLDGKQIGTDGVDDGMNYIVYDKKEAETIEKTTGLYTAAVSSKITVGDGDMVKAIGDAVTRSDKAAFVGTLKPKETATGGFAETGVSGHNYNGGTVVTVAKDGPLADPRDLKPAEISLPPDADIKAHVHGSGQITEGDKSSQGNTIIGSTSGAKFEQRPSDVDISNASAGTNIVVGARDRTVYFYGRTGNQKDCKCLAKMSLSNFLKIK
jgi:RHS repeat-associated protein